MLNWPNILTISRIILTGLFLLFINQDEFLMQILAASVFLLGSLTDLLDGYLARKYNLITDFGKIMDPIADKCLMLSAFYVFKEMGIIMPWAFWLIAFREIVITIWRLRRMIKKQILPAEKLGKYKTASQVIAIYSILFLLVFRYTNFYNGISYSAKIWWLICIDYLTAVAVILTVVSGLQYFTNWKKIPFRKCL